jgi:hypothetical protein
MEKVYSIEERVVLIVEEFLDNVKEKGTLCPSFRGLSF